MTAVQPCTITRADSPSIVLVERERGLRLTRQLGQSSSNQNTEGNTKRDAVERKAKAHAHRNAHADGRLTFLAFRSEQSVKEQVGSPMQSSTFYRGQLQSC